MGHSRRSFGAFYSYSHQFFPSGLFESMYCRGGLYAPTLAGWAGLLLYNASAMRSLSSISSTWAVRLPSL